MNTSYIIAFDQGTTSTRAILFDEKGGIVATSQKELTQHYPQSGWVEHDPMQLFKDQQETFEDVIAKANVPLEAIKAIGITNQRETTIVWDKHTGEPVYNAICWLDKRTEDSCEGLRERGLSRYIAKNTGLVIDSYFSATKIKWILDHVEGAREKAEAGDLLFGTVDSWLIFKFTGKHRTDHTNASRTMLYNIKEMDWDDDLLEELGIPKNMLPQVQPSSSDFGSITYQNTSFPIYGVAGDQQAALFGQGGYKSGMAKNTYGTGCFMLLNTGKKPSFSKSGLITTLCCTLEDKKPKYALEGSVFVGGASIQWLRDQVGIIENAEETNAICQSIPPLKDLFFVPAFNGLGAPYWDGNAKGSIQGLTFSTGRKELVKATVEALAYQVSDLIKAMEQDSGKQIKTLKVDGGACANDYLMQFQADMLDAKVDRPEMLEVTAMGAALLAGIKAGIWTQKDIASLRKVERIFDTKMGVRERNHKQEGWDLAVMRTRSGYAESLEKEKTPLRFSIIDRKRYIKKAKKKKFDLVIIGGGVTGAGIALDAATRGMSVCLVEKNDFASGTSNKSTKLVHGGLRYLKQMEIGLVKESGTERAIVHKLAPHLVVPEKMLLPLIEGGQYGKTLTSIGLKVYDLLASVEGDDKRQMLTKEETLEREPILDESKVLGGGYYAEYRTDDARLTIELMKKAAGFGAVCLNYCEMSDFVYNYKGKITSVNCLDHNTGQSFEVEGRTFVSAAGSWVDKLRAKDESMNNKHLHLTKGVHLVFPKEKLPVHQSLYFDVPDGRMIFAIPRGRVTYVGTTDTNYSGNLDRVVATKDDIKYLLDAVNGTFPDINLTEADVESSWAGLRPLIHEEEKDPSELSRKDETFISKSGLISIAGGKLTGYRKMAQRVNETVSKRLKEKYDKTYDESRTQHIALTSHAMRNSTEVEQYQAQLQEVLAFLNIENAAYKAWYLTSTYGKQTEIIKNKINYFRNRDVNDRLLRAELWYSVHYEMTNSLADFFVRRTGRLYFDITTINQFRQIAVEDFINYLDWDEARVNFENAKLDELLYDATHFYDNEIEA
ncbi:glycerol kinase GlpK [Leeuwenhoekiella polynyae]|uniref:Glycerol kinase n=1 Tax=Leeuwenhoekiella polynyae TaxID=1550906 RepID=A0A4Q0P1U6_9FLAO|nr:glycerol kinase GlpK [Leeuwenhoekiella polynyae]RXG18636.1 glycerol kinase [Leeuwenhoekiella polynyae]